MKYTIEQMKIKNNKTFETLLIEKNTGIKFLIEGLENTQFLDLPALLWNQYFKIRQ